MRKSRATDGLAMARAPRRLRQGHPRKRCEAPFPKKFHEMNGAARFPASSPALPQQQTASRAHATTASATASTTASTTASEASEASWSKHDCAQALHWRAHEWEVAILRRWHTPPHGHQLARRCHQEPHARPHPHPAAHTDSITQAPRPAPRGSSGGPPSHATSISGRQRWREDTTLEAAAPL